MMERDSNPRYFCTSVFKTDTLNHSDTHPFTLLRGSKSKLNCFAISLRRNRCLTYHDLTEGLALVREDQAPFPGRSDILRPSFMGPLIATPAVTTPSVALTSDTLPSPETDASELVMLGVVRGQTCYIPRRFV